MIVAWQVLLIFRNQDSRYKYLISYGRLQNAARVSVSARTKRTHRYTAKQLYVLKTTTMSSETEIETPYLPIHETGKQTKSAVNKSRP